MKVTSFEISKKLKELGVDLESGFYYEIENREVEFTIPTITITDLGTPPSPDKEVSEVCVFKCRSYEKPKNGDFYKAYTLEDILEVLPIRIPWKHPEYGNLGLFLSRLSPYADRYGYRGDFDNSYFGVNRKDNETLSDTASRLLIKLIEDEIIAVDEVNNGK